MKVLSNKPTGFSWTHNRYLVQGKEVLEKDARNSKEAIVETVHLYDGIVQRTWYSRGEIIERHDLNLEGKAIRRLFYEGDKLVRREYHDRNGNHISTELFDSDGYIKESIQHGSRPRHWWYERGTPVKYTRGSETYVKDGSSWIRAK